ncbi:MAG: NAD-dependent deacetylase [Deltaproteobacteria bacterium]|nr:MAG: NAD-dependent deacetylase [Deltaproteobacteria bacterium]
MHFEPSLCSQSSFGLPYMSPEGSDPGQGDNHRTGPIISFRPSFVIARRRACKIPETSNVPQGLTNGDIACWYRSMNTKAKESIESLADYLSRSDRILVFTGAGVSTRSGIPDYRGPKGVWKRRQPVYYQDFMSSEKKRIEYWDFVLEGWEGFRDARPTACHGACVELERAGKLRAVVTQNIDGLHRKAGTSPERLVEIHGTNLEVECQSCGFRDSPEPYIESFASTRKPPRCRCGGLIKPATISFGQGLRSEDLQRASAAAAEADLVVSLGSTLSVYPAAGIPLLAAERGVPYIIVNMGLTEHDGHPSVALRLDGDVEEIFPPAVRMALELDPVAG